MTTPTQSPELFQQSAQDRCRRAIAYLKFSVDDELTADEKVMSLGAQESPVFQTFSGKLLTSYVVDEDDGLHFVQGKHVAASGMSMESFHATAVANLAALAVKHAKVSQYSRIYPVLMGGNFEASLIMVDAFWSTWYARLAPNGFVAAIPARDMLAFADAGDPQAIQELHDVCKRVWDGNGDHLLTRDLLVRRDGVWATLA